MNMPPARSVMKDVKRVLARAARTTFLGTTALALLATPGVSPPDGSETGLLVRAVILKRASVQVLGSPPTVAITPTDISRGFVDVPQPVQIAVRNNSTSGYILDFSTGGDLVRRTRIRGLGADVQVAEGGGGVVQPAAGRGASNTMHELSFRFELSSSVKPGVYPWPVQISVTPL